MMYKILFFFLLKNKFNIYTYIIKFKNTHTKLSSSIIGSEGIKNIVAINIKNHPITHIEFNTIYVKNHISNSVIE